MDIRPLNKIMISCRSTAGHKLIRTLPFVVTCIAVSCFQNEKPQPCLDMILKVRPHYVVEHIINMFEHIINMFRQNISIQIKNT